MRSDLPKSLQTIGAKPMLQIILDCVRRAGAAKIHVVIGGHDGDAVRAHFSDSSINWVVQPQPLGTGHAVLQAIQHIRTESVICVLYGDSPLISPDTIARLVQLAASGALALLTATLPDPSGYGRIKRDSAGQVSGIIEHKDADESERKITEINAGPIAVPAKLLHDWLAKLDNGNVQKEYYLTSVVDFALADGIDIKTYPAPDTCEASGVNNRSEQAQLERAWQLKNAAALMRQGVRIIDPERFDVRGECAAGKDCEIDVGVILEGKVQLHDRVRIGANNQIQDSEIGSDVTILPNCVIESATIHAGATIGPFARIRAGSVIGENCKVGNFVEIKNSSLGKHSKASHLAYIGDADVGANVNIGAGTITCNFDGKSKHRTTIGNQVFVGANVTLVAPLTVADGAVIAAGSTITKTIAENQLAVERAKLRTMDAKRFR